jgi:hypothetical protein
MKASTEAGFYVWWDGFGFHLRGVDPGAVAVFKGQIAVDTVLPKSAAKAVPATSEVTIEVTGNEINFSFKAGAAPSGLDLPICKPSLLSISVNNGTAALPVDHLHIGVSRFAVSNPMVLARG